MRLLGRTDVNGMGSRRGCRTASVVGNMTRQDGRVHCRREETESGGST